MEEKVEEAQREEKHYNRFRKNFAGKKRVAIAASPYRNICPAWNRFWSLKWI
ncbi:MAG: hypothetical protein LBF62_03505 [Tannerellaceae bacterium]|nr:hypothetical protein [Tannerellaceae bacterium]